MARVTEALSAVAYDSAERRQPFEAAAVELRSARFLQSETGPSALAGTAGRAASDQFDDRPGVGSRAIRGIALAIVLALPLWAAITWVALRVFD